MPKKVYWKELREELEETRDYIAQYQIQLSTASISGLTEPQITCINDVLTAITSCLALLPINTPVN